MEKQKNKKNKKKLKVEKYKTEEQEEMMRFVKILVVVIVLIVIVYFFTRLFVTKDLFTSDETEKTYTEGTINYDVTNIGSMLTKAESEYYVYLYDSESASSAYYAVLMTLYTSSDDAIKIYYADLANTLNEKFYTSDADEVNLKVTDINDFKVGDIALIKVKDGKITKVYSTLEEIEEVLNSSTETE